MVRFRNHGKDVAVAFAKKGEQTTHLFVRSGQVVDLPEEIGDAYGFENMDFVPGPEIEAVSSASVEIDPLADARKTRSRSRQ